MEGDEVNSTWFKKGATLTDKSAQKEFGLTQDEIILGGVKFPNCAGLIIHLSSAFPQYFQNNLFLHSHQTMLHTFLKPVTFPLNINSRTMVQWCNILSRIAAAITLSSNISPHSPYDLLEVRIILVICILHEEISNPDVARCKAVFVFDV